jgi:protein TonB
MIVRHAIAVVLGTLVTLGVLFVMQTLIATARQELDESGTRHFVDFVRVEREETVQPKDRRPEKPPKAEAPPPQTIQPRTDSVEPRGSSIQIAPVAMETEVSIGGLGLEAGDGDYLPIVKIAPVYPWKAQAQGIEGYCVVEYTVSANGTVKDVFVVEAEPEGVFERTSIDAALKFKYKPRVVNGEPIEVRGVRNLFRYTLEG